MPPHRPPEMVIILATWNVRSPLDNSAANRPGGKTTLILRELARYKAVIELLSETRFSEQGQMKEAGAGYTFCWSRHPRAEQQEAGVAFLVGKDVVRRLSCLPQSVMRMPPSGDKVVTAVSTCALSMINSGEMKSKSYEGPHALPATVSKTDKLVAISEPALTQTMLPGGRGECSVVTRSQLQQ
ncbi:hypothetical protein SprV_0200843200 [Sparganum proliferum]